MDPKRIQTDKITIREFRLIKGQIDSPFDFKISNIKSFDFKVDFNTGFNLEEGLVKADFAINISSVSKEPTTEATSTYHFVFLFHVDDLKENAQLAEDKSMDWNPFLANAIASITYSTSRGILMSRVQGTVMQDFILPVVDPNTLWNKKLQEPSAS
jgi:hypothetical protein